VLAQAIALIEAFGGTAPNASVLQVPYVANEPWLGGTLPPNFEPTAGRLSIPVFGAAALAIGATSCAIVIDQWDESIPMRDETTAVAFHYDQPDAMPPQSLLLVVPPVVRGRWHWHD